MWLVTVRVDQRAKHGRAKNATMSRGRRGSGRIRCEESVGIVHGVVGMSMRVWASSGGIGRVRPLRPVGIPFRVSVHHLEGHN